jgi:dipeptidyl aminopeptidase/acylaminoacyl peptidase
MRGNARGGKRKTETVKTKKSSVWRLRCLRNFVMYPRNLAIGLVAFSISAHAAGLIPVEDFARPPTCSEVQLSPDGEYVAFRSQHEEVPTLFFAGLEKMKKQPIALGDYHNTPIPLEAGRFRWITDRRVILTATIYGRYLAKILTIDRDAKKCVALLVNENEDATYSDEVLHAFQDGSLLMLDRKDASGSGLRLYPDVVRVNSYTARYRTEVSNPGNVLQWFADGEGRVRLAMTDIEGPADILIRSDETKNWRPLPVIEGLPEYASPLGFVAGGRQVVFSGLSKEKRRAIFCVDVEKMTPAEVLFENPDYDVGPYQGAPEIEGQESSCVVFSPGMKRVLAIRYIDEVPKVKWLDEGYSRMQELVDASLSSTINIIQGVSTDERKMLVFAFSDCDPGTYYLFDSTKNDLTGLLKTRVWIKPEGMAAMHPIKYPARDGVDIHGYITVPVGQEPHNLPLVVMPHGGPWVRDIWGFDPLVQMLASRGYAVLQMNYRGSPGYGQAFLRKGRREVGGAIQQDIEDATRWAIEKKIADPKRIAIVGSSYGGYSALYALGKSPALYRCGISICGVTDWFSLFGNLADPEYKFAREHWVNEIGDPEKDKDKLKAISPLYFASSITAQVLIIQGKEDRIVPPKQAKMMIAALEKAGNKPESLFIEDEGHGFHTEKGLLAEYKVIEAFLAKHLGTGANDLATPKQ